MILLQIPDKWLEAIEHLLIGYFDSEPNYFALVFNEKICLKITENGVFLIEFDRIDRVDTPVVESLEVFAIPPLE